MTVLEQAQQIRQSMDAAALVLTDEQALASAGIYPRWEELAEAARTVEQGFRFRYGGGLYKTRQGSYTFRSGYVPGTAGTESLFEAIDMAHAGTLEDPIPYDGNMALEEGSYYSQAGAVYLCVRSTGDPVYHALGELVGLYVEAVYA